MGPETGGSEFDAPRLRELCEYNHAARAMFHLFSLSRKNRSETKTDRLEVLLGKRGITRPMIIDVFREMETSGCGKYVEGRKGNPSRFQWRVGISEMAKAVLGPEEQPEDIVDETDAQAWEAEEPDSVPSEADPSDEQHCGKLRHTFHLRREFQVEIDLPADLTENEARRLAAFVQLLAID